MTLKQILLSVLTVFVTSLIGSALLHSWDQPQVQSRLELYQTHLALQAGEWQSSSTDPSTPPLQSALFGEDSLEAATKQYGQVRQGTIETLERFQTQLGQGGAAISAPDSQGTSLTEEQVRQLTIAIDQTETFLNELDINLGILQAQQENIPTALNTWNQIRDRATPSTPEAQIETALSLAGLWNTPPKLLPDVEPILQRSLRGWFRFRALERLYQLQQRQDALNALQVNEQAAAGAAIKKLVIFASIPILGLVLGSSLLLGLIAQRFLKGKESFLARISDSRWSSPWDGEMIWQVLVLFFTGQFLVGQLLLPLFLHRFGINVSSFGSFGKALASFAMYGVLALVGLGVLWACLHPFRPLPPQWFRFNWRSPWLLWGLGGYLTALPLVIGVSLINQTLWQGQGGSNPLLTTILENRDRPALIIFFLTAGVAAPLFEEVFFRGFLMASLSASMSVWGAIALSSLIFAIVHLSVSEILPLFVLGMVLGVVYTRTRNLLAPMVVHSLWNSGTLLSLVLLGSGTQ